ncbi:16S rRNA (uracil(1498)-N(3))-methyltransferase [Bartonella ancashensis]|uniref:16S rRNA (uracil(1498)-N(3))-methyltransferase n=1 Tax=Bartonella ancashensis TaxID=1318743 RepID=UPI0006B51AB6|nr:16S rRNA (uracil(1498)-N(3))-methyltransferase [Bartonella ancashensis]
MCTSYKFHRLFVRQELSLNGELVIEGAQFFYLAYVLRMKKGAKILLFNGHDGEWLAELTSINKKNAVVQIINQERLQTTRSDLVYCFAPLKHARLDYMVQKAVEMGVSVLQPVITHHTQVTRINVARIEANIVEAAEQCGVLYLPECAAPVSLKALLSCWDNKRSLFFCDESHELCNPLPFFKKHGTKPAGILVGPEGGFSEEERFFLKQHSFTIPISLGPRILRADTAAIVALAIVNATIGDWGID